MIGCGHERLGVPGFAVYVEGEEWTLAEILPDDKVRLLRDVPGGYAMTILPAKQVRSAEEETDKIWRL